MKPQLKTIMPYQPGKNIEDVKAELGLEQVVKLASNENPFGCSHKAVQAMQSMLSDITVYPDGAAQKLRDHVSHHIGVSGDRLIFGNGTDELLHIISRSFLSPGLNTVMPKPSFPQYKRNAVIDGAEVREVPLVKGKHDLETMLATIDDQTAVVWLCNPNNPTGEYIRDAELRQFLYQVPESVLVVVDEAYYEYVTADDFPDCLQLIEEFDNVIFTRTFSKAYGLAGLRIGYGVGDPNLIRGIEPAREPFNSSRIAQAAALAALDDQDFVNECREKNQEGLNAYYRFCQENNLDYFPSQANFILIDTGVSGDDVYEYLLRNGYIVRSGTALGYPTGIRVTVGEADDNEAVISLLERFYA